MADTTSMPAGAEEAKTDVTIATTTDNAPAPEAPAAAPAPAPAPAVDLHGLDPNQLGDIAKFLKGQGGFEALKFRMSNPEKTTQPAQPAQPAQQPAQQPTQPAQPQTPTAPEVPKGYVSPQALQIKGYFDKLAADPKYANIAEQISNGDVLKEMASFGMTPIDDNFNVNVDQLTKFLDLKSASVPAKPATTEVTTTPTADYTPVEGEITSAEQAWNVIRENVMYTSQGKTPNPALAQAEEYLKKAGVFGPVTPTAPAQPAK